jgi:hypothetical protein
VCYCGRSSAGVIDVTIEIVCESDFALCRSLTSVPFESDSILQQVDKYAFQESRLISDHIPASVGVLCKECFASCK